MSRIGLGRFTRYMVALNLALLGATGAVTFAAGAEAEAWAKLCECRERNEAGQCTLYGDAGCTTGEYQTCQGVCS